MQQIAMINIVGVLADLCPMIYGHSMVPEFITANSHILTNIAIICLRFRFYQQISLWHLIFVRLTIHSH